MFTPHGAAAPDPIFEPERREIERVRQALQRHAEPPRPERPAPVSLEQYRRYVKESGILPTPAQIERLLEELDSDLNNPALLQAGELRVVPVLVSHPHGYPQFPEGWVERTGHLRYYFVDGDQFTLLPDLQVFLDAVYPSEVVGNGVQLGDIRMPERRSVVLTEFQASIRRLTEMLD